MIENRNYLHTNELQEIMSRNNLQSGTYQPDQVKEIIGKALYGKLQSATNTIYGEIEYIISNYQDIKNEIKKVFSIIFPGAKMIEFVDKSTAYQALKADSRELAVKKKLIIIAKNGTV